MYKQEKYGKTIAIEGDNMAVVFLVGILIILLFIVIILSSIYFRIDEIKFLNKPKRYLDYKAYIELRFLGKIKIFSIMLVPKKVKQIVDIIKIRQKIEQINWNQFKKELPSKEKIKEIIKKLNIKLQKFHLELEIGTQDILITSFLVAGFASILGIILPKIISKYNKEKYFYKILPNYYKKNMVKLSLNCIIQVKMVHIISIIPILLKGKEKKKNERTSNRRSYDYGYEQY